MKTRPTYTELALWVALPMAETSKVEKRLTRILDTTRSCRVPTRRTRLTMLAVASAALVLLAMLRPAAHAQAVSDPVSAQTQGNKAVQLVGITDATVLGGEWWGADGKRLSEHPANPSDQFGASGTKITAKPGQAGRFFAFHLPAGLRNAPLTVSLAQEAAGGLTFVSPRPAPGVRQSPFRPGERVRSSGPYLLSAKRVNFSIRRGAIWSADTVEARAGGSGATSLTAQAVQIEAGSGSYLIYGAALPANLSQTDVRVGTPSGPWKRVGAVKFAPRNATYVIGRIPGSTDPLKELLSSQMRAWLLLTSTAQGQISLSTEGQEPVDVRLIAVDKQGRQNDLGETTVDVGGPARVAAQVPQPLRRIKEIQIETRPFIWTEFKHVALQPSPTPKSGTEGTQP